MIGPDSRHRVLFVTRNLPPLTGGMERLNWNLAREIAQSFDVCLCGPNGSADLRPPNVRLAREFASQPSYRFFFESLVVCLNVARRVRPSIIIAGSGVTAPHVWLASRLTGARSVVYLHGLDLIVDYGVYRTFFLPAIRRADLVLANSRCTAGLAYKAGVAAEQIALLHPGVSLPGDPVPGGTAAFLRRIGAADRAILLSVGRLAARKGLVEFVRHSLPAIVVAEPSALLVVIGGEASEKLGARQANQRELILREANNLGLREHLCFLGRVDEHTLEQAYRACLLHVFPVLDSPGDVEGFGMVAIEAAAYGRPTIAFAAGGVPDAVSHHVSGLLIEPRNYRAFADAVIDVLKGKHAEITDDGCRSFAEGFAWHRFGERARSICEDLIETRV